MFGEMGVRKIRCKIVKGKKIRKFAERERDLMSLRFGWWFPIHPLSPQTHAILTVNQTTSIANPLPYLYTF